FDPVYDSMYFDLGFPKGSKPFLIPLRKDLASPFSSTTRALRPIGPSSNGHAAGTPTTAPTMGPAGATSSAAPTTDKSAVGGAPASAGKPTPVEIDFEGIEDRVVAYPVPEGKYLRVEGSP